MPTLPLLPERYYHIFNRGNNKENLFKEERNYIFFLKKFKHYMPNLLEVHAYCLMPNHFHFLVKIKEGADSKEVSNAFRLLFMSYTKAVNKATGREGSLFRHQFHRKLVDSEAYYTQLIPYIHANPVKDGFCKACEDWRYSSYNAFLASGATLVERQAVLPWFGGKEGFKQAHRAYVGGKVAFAPAYD